MSIHDVKISSSVIEEINRRRAEISRTSAEVTHLSRIPFAILESNAVKGSDNSLAKNNVLSGYYSDSKKNNIQFYGDELGHRPPPGITSITVNNKTPIGSVRQAVIEYQVWDVDTLTNFQKLYMNPGVYLFLQWGYNRQTTYPLSIFRDTSILELLDNKVISSKIALNKSNYDAIVGICVNFSWQLNSFGGFNCSTTIMSPSSLAYSFEFNKPSMKDNIFYQWITNRKKPTTGVVMSGDTKVEQNDINIGKSLVIVFAGYGYTDTQAQSVANAIESNFAPSIVKSIGIRGPQQVTLADLGIYSTNLRNDINNTSYETIYFIAHSSGIYNALSVLSELPDTIKSKIVFYNLDGIAVTSSGVSGLRHYTFVRAKNGNIKSKNFNGGDIGNCITLTSTATTEWKLHFAALSSTGDTSYNTDKDALSKWFSRKGVPGG